MIITTTETVPNKTITEVLGVARGSTVRARNVGLGDLAVVQVCQRGTFSRYPRLRAYFDQLFAVDLQLFR